MACGTAESHDGRVGPGDGGGGSDGNAGTDGDAGTDGNAGTDGGPLSSCPAAPSPTPNNGVGSQCSMPGDCATDFCVVDRTNSAPYCTKDCSASSCPSGFTCDSQTFHGIVVYCRKGTDAPPPPSKSNSIRCTSDRECACAHAGAVCGTYAGQRGCTIVCSTDDDCQPTVGGVKFLVESCQPDQATGNKECLPNPSCDPASPPTCFQSPGLAGDLGLSACPAPGPVAVGGACGGNCDCQSQYCAQPGGLCCTGAGAGSQGATCSSDCDCAAGLECATGKTCCPGPGNVPYLGACTASCDCGAGYACANGRCQ